MWPGATEKLELNPYLRKPVFYIVLLCFVQPENVLKAKNKLAQSNSREKQRKLPPRWVHFRLLRNTEEVKLEKVVDCPENVEQAATRKWLCQIKLI